MKIVENNNIINSFEGQIVKINLRIVKKKITHYLRVL